MQLTMSRWLASSMAARFRSTICNPPIVIAGTEGTKAVIVYFDQLGNDNYDNSNRYNDDQAVYQVRFDIHILIH